MKLSFKHFVSILLITLLLPTFSAHAKSPWQKVNLKDLGFSFSIPGENNMTENDSEIGKTIQYVSDLNGSKYFFTYVIHSTTLEGSDYEELKSVSIESFNETLNGEIKTTQNKKLGKAEGKLVEITLSDGTTTLYYWIGFKKDIQIQAIVVLGADDKDAKKNCDKFFKSIKIK